MKKTAVSTLVFVFLLLFASPVWAVCPICIIGLGAGLEISQKLGIDDTITFLWLGAIIISLIIWTIDWLKKKNLNFHARKIIVILFYLGTVLFPAYLMLEKNQSYNHPTHQIWGIDKLWVGTVLGVTLLFFGLLINNFLKKKNNGKIYFPFQRATVLIIIIAMASATLHFLCFQGTFKWPF